MTLATTEAEVDLALEGDRLLVFKHSYRCPTSLHAYNEVVRFTDEHPRMPVLMIDVVSNPLLSRYVERRLQIPHASPQIILVLEGLVWWYASNGHVRADSIERALRP